MTEELPQPLDESLLHKQESISTAIGEITIKEAIQDLPALIDNSVEARDPYQAVFEEQKDHLESKRQKAVDRAHLAKERSIRMAKQFEEKKGYPPTEEWIASLITPAEQAVITIESQLEFLRPTSEEDKQYRLRVMDELPRKIKEAAPAGLPLRFHGTPIYTARDIFTSKGLSSSVDRLGIETSYDVADQVSVTTPETLRVSLDSYTGLTEEKCCVPAGCVFVLLPASEQEADAGSSMLMNNVDFASNPDQLFAVMTSDENINMVQVWAQKAGIDPQKIHEFFAFADKLSSLKSSFEQGTANAADYAPYLKA